MAEPLSAILITYNAASLLPECLATLAFAEEILVVDSGSQDASCAIAQAAGARVLHHPWSGFGPQKQWAVQQARHDWVLCLDADERLTPQLQQQIQEVLRAPRYPAYRLPRCNRFMGRWLRHGEGYPDWVVRLFRRQHGQWSADPVHERVEVQGAIGTLTGDLLHESALSLHDYLHKQNHYTTLQAQQLLLQNRSIHLRHLLFSPLWRFMRFYFFKRGFLDGIPGLVHILIGCGNSFLKYAKAMALRRQ
ncbi:glycosyltransferase family 2 protein [Candidatus Magnetaquicoccus inordinatus]|uniref:glycosyltransferase family 2 protein n=1 Tax=Candidatus Magnetaquicoccus inordinatus TaxID=2496818 RepID=UPI00102D04C1|nr:glycosyltransferase family 2 protein [Candidatus Magnetaquicoccus inordinatus]